MRYRSLSKRAAPLPVLLTVLLLAGHIPACFAQAVANAEVAGVVSDPSGAPIAGAEVRITETEKQTPRTVMSDAQGRYVFPNLPVGPYRLDISVPGFKTYAHTGILLQVGNHITLNATLAIGAMTEHVEVTAGASMVETKDNTISQVIDERRIVDLPLNGRQPTQLILLSGAALTTPGGGMTGSKNYYSSTTISVAGGQANGINYLLDGGDHNDSMTNVNMPIPFPDALQEFSVQTSALPARYGLHPALWSTRSPNRDPILCTATCLSSCATATSTPATPLHRSTTHSSGISTAGRWEAASLQTNCSSSAATRARGSAAIRPRPSATWPPPRFSAAISPRSPPVIAWPAASGGRSSILPAICRLRATASRFRVSTRSR
jgi:hypothetical protein